MGIPLSPGTLLAATLGLVAADWGSQLAGSSTVPGGPLDETAHFLTMLLVLWALGKRVPGRLWLPALIASVAIDADHIPDRLGFDFLTAGTPRPYTPVLRLQAGGWPSWTVEMRISALRQLRRQVTLRSEAVYRIHDFEDWLVAVEVVRVPGLRPGQRFRFTREAVERMDCLEVPRVGLSARRSSPTPPA